MAVARAQAPLGNFTLSAGTTVAKAITLTPGSVVAVAVIWASATLTCSVTDTLSNTYTAVAASLATNATSVFRGQCFLCAPSTTGATTITATISGSVNEKDIWIHELSGANTGTPLDIGAAGNGNSANPSINIVPTVGGAIVGAVSAVSGTVTVGSTYTTGLSQNGNLSEDKMGTGTGSQTVPFVNATSSQWVETAVAVQVGAGGGGTTVKQLSALGVG